MNLLAPRSKPFFGVYCVRLCWRIRSSQIHLAQGPRIGSAPFPVAAMGKVAKVVEAQLHMGKSSKVSKTSEDMFSKRKSSEGESSKGASCCLVLMEYAKQRGRCLVDHLESVEPVLVSDRP